MPKLIPTLLLIASIALLGSANYAKQRADAIVADEAPPEPADPKKKKPGEECKNSDECQRHHSCKDIGEKRLCVAPARPKLPPGVVT